MSSSTSVRTLVCLAATFGLLCFLPLRSLGKETTRSIGSLTPDQRNHLPDSTQVTLPRRGTVTLGALRAEHRARMERFSRAALWGKRVAEKISNPGPASSQKLPGVPPGPNTLAHASDQVNGGDARPGRPPVTGHQAGSPQNSATHTQQPPGGINQSAAALTAVAQAQPQVAPTLNKSGAGSPRNSGALGTAAQKVQSTLIPRQTYNMTIPKDFTDFCNAALASACVYLPPNTTFAEDYSGNPRNPNVFVLDTDPLITDLATCTSLGGSLDGMQQCVFKYFSVQTTNFKYPGGTASWGINCDPSYYRLDAKGGMVEVFDLSVGSYTTGAAPFACAIQLYFNQ